MILATAKSRNGVLIRLTDERWKHIIFYHKEFVLGDFKIILGIITSPDVIFLGTKGEFLAAKKYSKKKWIVVIYKESNKDGFVITSYFVTDIEWLFRKQIIWTKK
ncbi:MAG: hypothetical protein Q8L28_00450 [bacterium]|nr:hypothetical protein [bacterium]